MKNIILWLLLLINACLVGCSSSSGFTQEDLQTVLETEWQTYSRDKTNFGGGIAMPPLRCAIWYALENREQFGDITIVYGARKVHDLVFRQELDRWAEYDGVRVVRCVDPGGETPDWKGEVGFVPAVTERAQIPAENAVALVIGPPVMIKFTLPVLAKMGLADRDIYTSLENRMKCGVGKCGRCNCGPVYVCKEGPVFTLEQLKSLPSDY